MQRPWGGSKLTTFQEWYRTRVSWRLRASEEKGGRNQTGRRVSRSYVEPYMLSGIQFLLGVKC